MMINTQYIFDTLDSFVLSHNVNDTTQNIATHSNYSCEQDKPCAKTAKGKVGSGDVTSDTKGLVANKLAIG